MNPERRAVVFVIVPLVRRRWVVAMVPGSVPEFPGSVAPTFGFTASAADISGFSGSSLGGRVRVELDDDGRLADLVLDPRVTHLSVEELRCALMSAFAGAQDELRKRISSALTPYAIGGQPAPDLAAATEIADRRFAEISTALHDLSRRAVPRW